MVIPPTHLYFYYLDRAFGRRQVRLATWLPCGIHVCLNGRAYLTRRRTVGKGVRGLRWIPRRPAGADRARRVEIRRAAKERYWEALSVVDVPCPARELLDGVSRPAIKDKRPYRALRLVRPQDAAVFEAVLSG